jgi:hypothetical protein
MTKKYTDRDVERLHVTYCVGIGLLSMAMFFFGIVGLKFFIPFGIGTPLGGWFMLVVGLIGMIGSVIRVWLAWPEGTDENV